MGPTGRRESAAEEAESEARADHLTRVLLAAGAVPLILGGYVLLLLLGLPTVEYVAVVLGPTLSVLVGFVLAGRISVVRQTMDMQHRETVTVLSDQNAQVASLANVVAAAVLPAQPAATDTPSPRSASSSPPGPPSG